MVFTGKVDAPVFLTLTGAIAKNEVRLGKFRKVILEKGGPKGECGGEAPCLENDLLLKHLPLIRSKKNR